MKIRIARVGTNTGARMTMRTTRERGNRDKPLGIMNNINAH